MTIQVGLVGSDGIVLASDTKWTYQPREEQAFWGGRYGTNGTKIKLTPQIAVSCAEDMETAGFLADEIIRYTKSGDNRPQKTVLKEIAARIPRQHEHPAKCLAVVSGDSPVFIPSYIDIAILPTNGLSPVREKRQRLWLEIARTAHYSLRNDITKVL